MYYVLELTSNKDLVILTRVRDIVAYAATRPYALGLAYWDIANAKYVKPGKRKPVKDNRTGGVYSDYPSNPVETIARLDWFVAGFTLEQYREHITRDRNDSWDSWFEDQHARCTSNMEFITREPIASNNPSRNA